MARGRDKFRKFKPVINCISKVYLYFPKACKQKP